MEKPSLYTFYRFCKSSLKTMLCGVISVLFKLFKKIVSIDRRLGGMSHSANSVCLWGMGA